MVFSRLFYFTKTNAQNLALSEQHTEPDPDSANNTWGLLFRFCFLFFFGENLFSLLREGLCVRFADSIPMPQRHDPA